MGKKVVHVDSNGKGARVIIGPSVKNSPKRKGKGFGTGNLNRQSSKDKPKPAKP